jgi:hypothetical protein
MAVVQVRVLLTMASLQAPQPCGGAKNVPLP